MLGFVLGWILTLFILVLIARVIADWATTLEARGEFWAQARRFTHTVTEPVIAPVRRILPPVRFGSFGLDLAFTVVFVAALLLRSFLW
ncbi:YggT family protein [Crossiella equi]|uniref:YggT family protein n=1 Tax=Crossiella equi TaxID=130796 RepID=A0ABS5AQS7_9PSEU|nr:YggT family protein [Crossiella equi]MBP2478569.1 YggT family protein [Crossiella equi]